MQNYDSKKVKKVLIFIATFIIGIIAISVIFILFRSKSASEQAIHGDDGSQEKTVIFENRYQIDYSIGNYNSAVVLTQIENAILDENELSSAPSENNPGEDYDKNYSYISTIDELSFEKTSREIESYYFILNISDNRKYNVNFLYDEDIFTEKSYLTTVLTRDDRASNKTLIYTSSEENSSYRQTAISWLKSLGVKETNITYIKDDANTENSE